jgi:hypothetical protein
VSRTSLRERVGAEPLRGRQAIYSPLEPRRAVLEVETVDGHPTPVHPPPETVDGRPSAVTTTSQRRWDDAHQRVTFYCPRPLLRAVERRMAHADQSKSQVIVSALRRDLGGAE